MAKRGIPLPIAVYWQARQMYAELDQFGRPCWSMREVAAKLGISETSVLRAVTNTGRFANFNATPLPPTRSEAELAKDAAESLERFLALQAQERIDAAKPTPKSAVDIFMERTSARPIPPSPLEGGDAPSEADGTGLARLAEIAGAGDAMLDELTGSTTKGEENGPSSKQ